MIVADSSVLIAWFRKTVTPQTQLLWRAAESRGILLGDLVLMELLQGARSDQDAARIEDRLRSFEFATMVDRPIVLAAARHFRTLREAGITMRKQIDLLIGTFCIVEGHELLHADRDFEPMRRHLGLRVAGPPEPVH